VEQADTGDLRRAGRGLQDVAGVHVFGVGEGGLGLVVERVVERLDSVPPCSATPADAAAAAAGAFSGPCPVAAIAG
jgi:hypothetical protein